MRKGNSEFWICVFYIALIVVCVLVSKYLYIWIISSEMPDWLKWMLLH